jgi:hypothetical protein
MHVAFLASLAAAIAVPCSVQACTAKAAAADCCCKHSAPPAQPTSCHHHAAQRTNCLTKSCDCCRPAAPQNVPPERSSIHLTSIAVPVDAPACHGGSELATPLSGVDATHLVVVPHRILHCSWLI